VHPQVAHVSRRNIMAQSKSSMSRADAKRRFARLSRKVQNTSRRNVAAIKASAHRAALKEANDCKRAALKAARTFSAEYAAAGQKVARLKLAVFKADLKKNLGRGSAAEVAQLQAEFVAMCSAATAAISKKFPWWLAGVVRFRPVGSGPRDRGRPPSNRGRDSHGSDAGDEHTDGADEP
jgi:hypothetical protein